MKGRILGVDYGDARTGLAISDPDCFLANGIGTIHSTYDREVAEKVVAESLTQKAVKIVVGNPINMNGTAGPRCDKIAAFCELLKTMTALPVEIYDERLTTVSAYRFLNETGTHGKKRKNVVDTLAAQIILQDYLDRCKSAGGPSHE